MEPPRFLSDIFPQDQADQSWVPEGMDPNSSYRLAVRVGAYVKLLDDGTREYCNACNIPRILDRDSTNWNDVLADISTEINLGSNHKLRVTYWDEMSRSYEEITSDQKLLAAIDMYWEIRRLSLQVCVMKKDESDSTHDIGRQQSMPCVLLGSTDASQISAEPSLEITSLPLEPPIQSSNEVPWVDDVVEYVGLDDEDHFKTLLSDSSDSEHGGLEDDVACDGLDDDLDDDLFVQDDVNCDDLFVEDAWDCETIVHATDLENPTIEIGMTFGDGDTFKKAIRQYAIKGEYEIATRYSESTRYRGYCKVEGCKWQIHVSQLQDGRTWKIKKIPEPHTCQSTEKVEKNNMATNHWVRDRVLDWLAKVPKIGPKALQKRLEEQYHLRLSYMVVWDGRNMALEQLKGKWDDSFQHIFSFKAEVEKTNPGSLVDIEYEKVGNKFRFTRMFVALKACVDGFLNGCRPFLGVDSTHLTGKWKGQLASATAVDGHNWMFPVCYAVFGSETIEN